MSWRHALRSPGSTGRCRTKERAITEHVHADAHGTPKHYEIHVFSVCDTGGKVTHIIEYNVDITERKRAQRGSASLHIHLYAAQRVTKPAKRLFGLNHDVAPQLHHNLLLTSGWSQSFFRGSFRFIWSRM